jgi:hypothetical protein
MMYPIADDPMTRMDQLRSLLYVQFTAMSLTCIDYVFGALNCLEDY